MQTSPWVILGLTAILLMVVIALAVQNTRSERRSMTQVLRAKGAALIRAVEAGTRTGMMGMMWGGRQIQRLLEETGQLPDVMYVAVVDEKGQVVAHSDPSLVHTAFRPDGWTSLYLAQGVQEKWELVDLAAGRRVFEVHRHFRPLRARGGRDGRGSRGMMRRHGMAKPPNGDWFSHQDPQPLFIVVGLEVAAYEQAIRNNIRTTIIISASLLLLGFGGVVSLFWMNSYRTAKRTLQDTSAFADEVVARLPVGLIATDGQGMITFFNAASEQITGLNAPQATGRKAEAFLPAPLADLKQMVGDGAVISEKEMTCTFADGRTVPLSVIATRIINAVGDLVGHMLILRDLREVRRLQDEIRRQEKLAAIGGLAAGVAHEIRNPLSSIKGLATFFGEQFDAGTEAKEASQVMIHEVDRLNRVITELLDFSRPTDINSRPTQLAPLLSHSLQLIHQDAAKRGISVEVDVREDICLVSIDPDRMSQCLLNLYLNAIQAMPDGGTLTIIGRNDEDGSAAIVVRDTGKGIAGEQLSMIFNPYYTTKGKGTGLGLAIVHKIVEAHNGHILAESIPEEGSTFTITLPCADAAAG